MTCGQKVRCSLCEPSRYRRRDKQGRYTAFPSAWVWPMVIDFPAVQMEGEYHVNLCQGCAERALGRKLKPGELRAMTEFV